MSINQSPVEKFINESTVQYLDGMDPQLITDLIETIGGEDVFLASYKHINTNGSLTLMKVFETADEVNDFYDNHKSMVLDHCAESAYRIGEDSAVQKVASLCYGRGYSLDQVADALFGSNSEDSLVDIQSSIRNIAICNCLDNISRAFEEAIDNQ